MSNTKSNAIEALFEAIQRRPRPEDVAQIISEIKEFELNRDDARTLDQAAKNSLKRNAYGYSSMASDFARVVGADKMVAKVSLTCKIPDPPSAIECRDVGKVEAFMERVAESIKANPAFTDFLKDRLNREQRKAQGLNVKKRHYNKAFRAIRRLRDKIERMIRNGKKYEASRIAKSAGATKLTLDDLSKDLPTACFVAYLSARMNVRSTFTNTSQERAFDNVSNMLYRVARKSGTVNWWAIALVHPEPEVLEHLTDEEKGKLLGIWTETLHMLAGLLKETYDHNNFDLTNMIVRRGNDSSTWNSAAGAWNKAREHWFKLLFDLKMEDLLEHYCPGKVLRLMAADVVGWHSWGKGSLDDSLHPDTKVWRDLPRPWRVFEGQETCPMTLVETACQLHSVPKGGWAGPTPPKRAVAYRPTPELVQGVTVTSPFLAKVLKDAGWFKGKPVKDMNIPANVIRDEAGAVLYVEPGNVASQDPKSNLPPTPPSAPAMGKPEPLV